MRSRAQTIAIILSKFKRKQSARTFSSATQGDGSVLFYHGTGKGHLSHILKHGLQHSRDGHVYGLEKGQTSHVFLAETEEAAKIWALNHGLREVSEGKTQTHAVPVVLAIRVPAEHVAKLLPDDYGTETSMSRPAGAKAYKFPKDIPPEWIEHVSVGPKPDPNTEAEDQPIGPWNQGTPNGGKLIYAGLAIADKPIRTKPQKKRTPTTTLFRKANK